MRYSPLIYMDSFLEYVYFDRFYHVFSLGNVYLPLKDRYVLEIPPVCQELCQTSR